MTLNASVLRNLLQYIHVLYVLFEKEKKAFVHSVGVSLF